MNEFTNSTPQKRSVSVLAFGTHHKTGTKWIRGALRQISKKCRIPLHHNPSASDNWVQRISKRPALVFSGSSRFPEALRNDPNTHVVHMIRDPRDMLISAMRYHCKATDRHEKFLYRPRPDLGGASYQEHLNGLDTYEDKLMFEMENHHSITVKQILSANLDAKFLTHWKYENLIVDHECRHFREVFETLDVEDHIVDKAVEIFRRNSLFSGEKRGAAGDGIHVSSGQPQQWKSKLPETVAKRYREEFGQVLIDLGYETDTNWLETLSHKSA